MLCNFTRSCAREPATSVIFVSRRGRERVQKTSRGFAVFDSRDAVAHTSLYIVGECALRYTFFHRPHPPPPVSTST